MSAKTSIEWTNATWNPTTGCTKISGGCQNCYAERMANRLHGMGNIRYRNNFKLTLQEDLLEQPLSWKKPRLIFVDSMSDLFHEEVPLNYIKRVFDTMVRSPHHIFQVLTKRSARLKELSGYLPWPENIWMGVSVESDKTIHRIDDVRKTPAEVKFLSCEPLIGPINNLDLKEIDWVIVGGESGPGARPIKKEWVDYIQVVCTKSSVPFFFKQWGGVRKKEKGRLLNGRTYDELPEPGLRYMSV